MCRPKKKPLPPVPKQNPFLRSDIARSFETLIEGILVHFDCREELDPNGNVTSIKWECWVVHHIVVNEHASPGLPLYFPVSPDTPLDDLKELVAIWITCGKPGLEMNQDRNWTKESLNGYAAGYQQGQIEAERRRARVELNTLRLKTKKNNVINVCVMLTLIMCLAGYCGDKSDSFIAGVLGGTAGLSISLPLVLWRVSRFKATVKELEEVVADSDGLWYPDPA